MGSTPTGGAAGYISVISKDQLTKVEDTTENRDIRMAEAINLAGLPKRLNGLDL